MAHLHINEMVKATACSFTDFVSVLMISDATVSRRYLAG